MKLTLTIQRLGASADGIAHTLAGKTVFIPYTAPGDTIEAEITKSGKRFDRAQMTRLLEPSPTRTTPRCPHFTCCGGCDWQHIDEETASHTKRHMVVDALMRIGKFEHAEQVVECVQTSEPYHYRNKIELVPRGSARTLVLGMHQRGSGELIAVEHCPLLNARADNTITALTGALRFLGGNRDLNLVRVGLRFAQNTKDSEISLITTPNAFPRAMAAKVLSSALPNATSIVRVLQKASGTRAIKGLETLQGRGFWRERLHGRKYAVSAPSFFQVNTAGAERLISLVSDMLSPDGSDSVLDLYSGVGTFALPLACAAKEVIAIESFGPAVRDLRKNAAAAEAAITVIGGDAAREITQVGHVDLCVVDPPRTGLNRAVADALLQLAPRTIAYVSCDPATLARDLALFCKEHYQLKRVVPVDLFAQTHHIECVAQLELHS